MNDKDKKSLEEGQWPIVSRRMMKFNKNVGHNVSVENVKQPNLM